MMESAMWLIAIFLLLPWSSAVFSQNGHSPQQERRQHQELEMKLDSLSRTLQFVEEKMSSLSKKNQECKLANERMAADIRELKTAHHSRMNLIEDSVFCLQKLDIRPRLEKAESSLNSAQTRLTTAENSLQSAENLLRGVQTKTADLMESKRELQREQSKLKQEHKRHAFRAEGLKSSHLSIGAHYKKVRFERTAFNIGDAFDSNTSSFVAPVNGAYLFSACATYFGFEELNDGHLTSIHIWEEPTVITDEDEVNPGGRVLGRGTVTRSQGYSTCVTCAGLLIKGQRVGLWLYGSWRPLTFEGEPGAALVHFEGHLIEYTH